MAQGTAQTYDAAKATGTNWNVDPAKQTVAGQLGSVLKEDSPVLQQARTQGTQQAAARGLVNSSMGVGAAEGAEKDMLDYVPELGATSRLSCQIQLTDALDGLTVDLPASQY